MLSTLISTIFTVQQPSIIEVKDIIQQACSTEKVFEDTCLTVLAIGSLETHHFEVDYPQGDNKLGDSANYGIYKMNKAHVRDIVKSKGPDLEYALETIHSNKYYASYMVIRGIKQQGLQKFLIQHRGGESGLLEPNKSEIVEYVSAVEHIKQEYKNNPNSWYNDVRYTIQVNPI